MSEAISYRDMIRLSQRLPVRERAALLTRVVTTMRGTDHDALLRREVVGPMDREVSVRDADGQVRRMLMFGSNNYLGLARHPRVRARATEALATWGVGVGGPPLLNGYSALHRELEQRLAAFEHQEDAVLFASGYAANLGLMSALPGRRDLVLYDAQSHASLLDGLKLGATTARSVTHNDPDALEAALAERRSHHRDVFVCVEGVYSMSGDVAPLDAISAVARRHGALLLVDDAHGTGVMGPSGRGSMAHFGADVVQADAVVGTFSKAFAVAGGFVAASQGLADTLRYLCRPYMFSASLAPPVVAAVLAGLDVLDDEPERHARLMANCQTLAAGLERMGVPANASTPIFPVYVPPGADLRASANRVHRRGLFVNHIEHPAVPLVEQRFRISVTADHTADDIDALLDVMADERERWTQEAAERPASGDGVASEPLPDVFQGGF